MKTTKKILTVLIILLGSGTFTAGVQAAMVMPKAVAEQIKIRGYEPSERGFFEAARDGNIGILGIFTEAGVYINIKDETGKTPVYYAAAAGKDKAVKFLLLCGADINLRDETLKSPLMAAIEANSYPTAKLLLDMNASVKNTDENGYTPLHYAVLNNQKEIAQAITNRFCNPDEADIAGNTPLYYAADKSPELIHILLNAGADINGHNEDGKTALHKTVIDNNIENAKFLIDNGANVNIPDESGNTPIFYAAQGSPIYILLLESGAKI